MPGLWLAAKVIDQRVKNRMPQKLEHFCRMVVSILSVKLFVKNKIFVAAQ